MLSGPQLSHDKIEISSFFRQLSHEDLNMTSIFCDSVEPSFHFACFLQYSERLRGSTDNNNRHRIKSFWAQPPGKPVRMRIWKTLDRVMVEQFELANGCRGVNICKFQLANGCREVNICKFQLANSCRGVNICKTICQLCHEVLNTTSIYCDSVEPSFHVVRFFTMFSATPRSYGQQTDRQHRIKGFWAQPPGKPVRTRIILYII